MSKNTEKPIVGFCLVCDLLLFLMVKTTQQAHVKHWCYLLGYNQLQYESKNWTESGQMLGKRYRFVFYSNKY